MLAVIKADCCASARPAVWQRFILDGVKLAVVAAGIRLSTAGLSQQAQHDLTIQLTARLRVRSHCSRHPDNDQMR